MDIEQIKKRVIDKGLAKKNRFFVNIPNISEESNLLAKAAGTGQLAIGFSPYRYTAPTSMHPNDLTHSDLEIEFYVDKEYNIRKEFQRWIDEIVDLTDGTFGYRDDYAQDITVTHLDDKNEPKLTTKYLSCVPKSLGELRSSFEEGDVVHTFTVSFIFNYYIPV